MSDIAAFIAARLDEDEQTAQAALTGPSSLAPDWSVDRYGVLGVPKADVMDSFGVVLVHDLKERVAEHIARQDPARTLLEVKAWRGVIDYLDPDGQYDREVFADIAAIWNNHPDYQEEWTA